MPNRILTTLLLPCAAVVLPAAVLLAAAPDVAVQAARAYPFAALTAALLLAMRLRRSRTFAASLVLLASAIAVRGSSPAAGALAAMLAPMTLAVLCVLRDSRMTTRAALFQVSIVCVPAVLAAAAAASFPESVLRAATREWIDPIYTSWTGLSQPALAMWLPALGVLGWRAVRIAQPAESGLFWCATAVLMLLSAEGTTAAMHEGVWLLAGGLVLVLSLVESSRTMAFHDELTGLPARRALNQALEALRAPYSIAIVDIDHFKTFNDRYGHDVGDQVLRMVAARLERVSGGGTAYRSGGEEFTVVFPGIARKEAAVHMDAAREAVADAKFTLRAPDRPKDAKGAAKRGRTAGREQKLGVTISVGLAEPSARAKDVDAVVKAADKAMYRAKKNGRNRVVA